MEPRVSLITLGVADLDRAVRFYRDGLGWPMSSASMEGTVAFFQIGCAVLGLWSRASLAEDARLPNSPPASFSGIALAHNVRNKEDVDAVLAIAQRAGATLLKPGTQADWGGYSGYFADPDGHVWEVAWNPVFPIAEDGSIQLPR